LSYSPGHLRVCAGRLRVYAYWPNADTTRADDESWGTPTALGVWLFSFVALIAAPYVAVNGYMKLGPWRDVFPNSPQAIEKLSETIMLLGVSSILAAHLLTFGLVRRVVTDRGERKFFDAIAWPWAGLSPLLKVLLVAGTVVGMVAAGALFSAVLPHTHETDFEKLIKTSYDVRVLLVLGAVFTAPIVEEAVYRGVLYPALSTSMGMWPAVMVVSILFFGGHVFQYSGDWGALAAIFTLSFALTIIRAKTRSILPCFAIHLLYNTFGAIVILLQGAH